MKSYRSTCIFFALFVNQVLGTTFSKDNRVTPFTAANDRPCVSPCEKRGSDEYWCFTGTAKSGQITNHEDWAKCSPKDGVTYKREWCTSPCTKHKDYLFCYTDENKNSWDYCGKADAPYTPFVLNQHFTRYGVPCVSPCIFNEKSLNWCYKAGGSWDFCSVNDGVDIRGQECDSTCDHHDRPFTLCTLSKGGWNYCGKISSSFSSHI